MSSCTVGVSPPQPVCYSPTSPSPSTCMEKPSTTTATTTVTSTDAVRPPHVLGYSTTSPTTTTNNPVSNLFPVAPDALRIAQEQLRRIYIAEASLLMNMEQCSNLPDLDHIQDSLKQLAVLESDIQRRLFAHMRFLPS
ncbi:hypothetical protein Q1695_002453 [Nippostrongylus brasiliensis]|nr:hypothetical protein Q1695_002453 [Nippostrongylus brasiliensis]